jgi:carbon-monoxide dehydrogenase iron sulfur subunit
MPQKKRTLMFDMRLCTGCKICELVCSFNKSGILGPASARIHIPSAFLVHFGGTKPAICRHCEKPPCAEACPVGAISKDPETGLTKVDENLCILCMDCIPACPFGGASFDPVAHVIAMCNQCGVCTEWCAPGAIRFVEEPNRVRERRAREAALPEIIRQSEKWPGVNEPCPEREGVNKAMDEYFAKSSWKESI